MRIFIDRIRVFGENAVFVSDEGGRRIVVDLVCIENVDKPVSVHLRRPVDEIIGGFVAVGNAVSDADLRLVRAERFGEEQSIRIECGIYARRIALADGERGVFVIRIGLRVETGIVIIFVRRDAGSIAHVDGERVQRNFRTEEELTYVVIDDQSGRSIILNVAALVDREALPVQFLHVEICSVPRYALSLERERRERRCRRSGGIAGIVPADVGKRAGNFPVDGEGEVTAAVVFGKSNFDFAHIGGGDGNPALRSVYGNSQRTVILFGKNDFIGRFFIFAHGELRRLHGDGKRIEIRIHESEREAEIIFFADERIPFGRREPPQRKVAAEGHAFAVAAQPISEIACLRVRILCNVFRVRRIEYQRIIDIFCRRKHKYRAHRRHQQRKYSRQ